MPVLAFPDRSGGDPPYFLSTIVCVFITDAFGRTLYADAEWMRLLGLALEQIQSGEWVTHLHPDDAEKYFREWCASLAHGTVFRESTRIRMSDGSFVKWDCLVYPLLDERGRIEYWRGVLWVGMTEQEAVRIANRRPFELTA